MKQLAKLVLLAMCSGSIALAWAESPNDLTIVGAQKGASSDGVIPAFSGHDTPQAGWSAGKVRGDYWKYKDEKPLFSITVANLDKYADKLSPGQIALFKQVKNYQ